MPEIKRLSVIQENDNAQNPIKSQFKNQPDD